MSRKSKYLPESSQVDTSHCCPFSSSQVYVCFPSKPRKKNKNLPKINVTLCEKQRKEKEISQIGRIRLKKGPQLRIDESVVTKLFSNNDGVQSRKEEVETLSNKKTQQSSEMIISLMKSDGVSVYEGLHMSKSPSYFYKLNEETREF